MTPYVKVAPIIDSGSILDVCDMLLVVARAGVVQTLNGWGPGMLGALLGSQ